MFRNLHKVTQLTIGKSINLDILSLNINHGKMTFNNYVVSFSVGFFFVCGGVTHNVTLVSCIKYNEFSVVLILVSEKIKMCLYF